MTAINAPTMSVTHDALGIPGKPRAFCSFSARHLMQEASSSPQMRHDLSAFWRIPPTGAAEDYLCCRIGLGWWLRQTFATVGAIDRGFGATPTAILTIQGSDPPLTFPSSQPMLSRVA